MSEDIRKIYERLVAEKEREYWRSVQEYLKRCYNPKSSASNQS